MSRPRVRVPLLPAPIRWGSVAVLAAAILYYSTVGTPPVPVDAGGGSPDAGAGGGGFAFTHAIGYAALAWSVAYALADVELGRWRKAALVVAVAGLFGATMELLQLGIDDRVFETSDLAANVLGAATVLAWYLLEPHLRLDPVGDDAGGSR